MGIGIVAGLAEGANAAIASETEKGFKQEALSMEHEKVGMEHERLGMEQDKEKREAAAQEYQLGVQKKNEAMLDTHQDFSQWYQKYPEMVRHMVDQGNSKGYGDQYKLDEKTGTFSMSNRAAMMYYKTASMSQEFQGKQMELKAAEDKRQYANLSGIIKSNDSAKIKEAGYKNMDEAKQALQGLGQTIAANETNFGRMAEIEKEGEKQMGIQKYVQGEETKRQGQRLAVQKQIADKLDATKRYIIDQQVAGRLQATATTVAGREAVAKIMSGGGSLADIQKEVDKKNVDKVFDAVGKNIGKMGNDPQKVRAQLLIDLRGMGVLNRDDKEIEAAVRMSFKNTGAPPQVVDGWVKDIIQNKSAVYQPPAIQTPGAADDAADAALIYGTQ